MQSYKVVTVVIVQNKKKFCGHHESFSESGVSFRYVQRMCFVFKFIIHMI